MLEHVAGEGPSLAEDSFRPLLGQLADQSSCLAVDRRDSSMEQLVGHPPAHSSMIGHSPGPSVPLSLDQGGWDSTLSRMIGRLSHQSGSHWLSGGQDFYAGQLMGQVPAEQSTAWLDEGPEENQMRPLVGELDESAGQHSGSSDERTHVDFGVSTEASGPSHPALPPEASSHSTSVPAGSPHVQSQTSPVEQDPDRTEVFAGSDSFHPLLAEVTHNETADPSMIFHHVPTSPVRQTASGECSDSESHSVESEPSPERFRTEALSSCQLITSQCLPGESVLMLSPTTRTDVELTALSLSNLTVCDDAATVKLPQPERTESNRSCFSEQREYSVSFSDDCAGELKSEVSHLRKTLPLFDKLMEAASEKGILEQSEITLVSLTDTTLQDQETTITEEDKLPDGGREGGQKSQDTEGSESSLSVDETPEEKKQTPPDSAMLLEFQWGPCKDLQVSQQQRRTALLQRSARRAEEVKARGALAKIQPEIQAPSDATEQSKTTERQPVTCNENTKLEPQQKINTKSKGGQAKLHQTTEKSAIMKQRKPQRPPPVSHSSLKTVCEVKSCTPEQRKQDVTEMHQRTRRLYEQLEEVKHQKAARNRQEDYAKNRLKAKEFHKKTLQKLRAKQTLK
ncbi:uncharacterized protein LOC131970152 [Centropristis striata]|uniref:uncharacterized protein LOC131970152 n=1 Tax=Centropristis striata TaxID=184440 RepID=UPI0027E0CC76|nr:uncharacterized protein LOC131970152 [Centropristis striata]